MWRTLQGVLPTAANLRSRMVPVQQLCPVCANERETSPHLLIRCSFARECWSLTSMPIPGQFEVFSAWLSKMLDQRSTEEMCIAIMMCWAIWLNRNNIVWRNICCNPSQLVHFATKKLAEWHNAQQCKYRPHINSDQRNPEPVRWV